MPGLHNSTPTLHCLHGTDICLRVTSVCANNFLLGLEEGWLLEIEEVEGYGKYIRG